MRSVRPLLSERGDVVIVARAAHRRKAGRPSNIVGRPNKRMNPTRGQQPSHGRCARSRVIRGVRHSLRVLEMQTEKEQEQKQELEPSFPSWAFSTVSRLRKLVGVGAILAAAVSIRNLEPHTWAGKSLADLQHLIETHASDRANLAFIQAAACFFLALLTPKPSLSILERRKNIDQDKLLTAGKACGRILILVMAIYYAWSVYYLITGLSLLQPQTRIDEATSVSLNTLPSLLLFWLYIELAELTVDVPVQRKVRRRKPVSTETISSGNAAFHRVFSVAVFALIITPVWYACGKGKDDTIFAFNVISSCLNGVALALVVGRLGSKVIDPGSITLGMLYFYAVIQATAPTFPHNVVGHLLATTVALPLKVLLWLVFVWAFTTGIISEYVYDIRVLLTRERINERLEAE
jgi:hypothetical protein